MRSTEIDRRRLLAAAAAGAFSLVVPVVSRAGMRRPAYVAARREADGSYAAIVLDDAGDVLFREALDGRGHDVALSPDRRLAVYFARRPGQFALVVDLEKRVRRLAFMPPSGRHFYGHGFFSADGRLLYATESGPDDEGVLGLYDVAAGFARVDAYPTGGVGPHEALLMPDGQTVVVANGGMLTHPDNERLVLNLASMAPSLAYIDLATGDVVDRVGLAADLHQVSLRHMDVDGAGGVWVGGQYQGPPTDAVPLVVRHVRGRDPTPIAAPPSVYASLRHYVGSVSANADGSLIATTSPRGGVVVEWEAMTGKIASTYPVADVCGVAPDKIGRGFLVSDGFGRLHDETGLVQAYPDSAWDNHLRKL